MSQLIPTKNRLLSLGKFIFYQPIKNLGTHYTKKKTQIIILLLAANLTSMESNYEFPDHSNLDSWRVSI
jgi:hypothetical protein